MNAHVTISLDELIQLKADARGFSFLPRQPVTSLLAGRHASRLRGRGLAFEELRHYNQGDDVRTIDWKATARLRSPHVRVYSEERERPVLLVVDQRRPMFFGSRRAMKSVTAAEIAALGAWRALGAGDRVGLVVFGDAPFLQAPFSTDLSLSRRLRDETAIGMAGPRTSFGDAIGLGVTLFDTSDAPAKTIIALTDGNDTASQVPPAEAALRAVAQGSGGSYFFAGNRQQLAGIYAELDQIETRQVKVISHRPRNDLFYWPLLAALGLWLVEKTFVILRQSRITVAGQSPGTVRVDPLSGKLGVLSDR